MDLLLKISVIQANSCYPVLENASEMDERKNPKMKVGWLGDLGE